MTADLDTLLTALYVLIDDHVIASGQRRRGHPKKLSDSELVCLAVAQVLLGARSEHHWLRLPPLFRVLWAFWGLRDHLGEARSWVDQLLPV